MTVPYHSHNFEIPTASRQDIMDGTATDKAVVPACLGSAAVAAIKDFASAAQGVKADNAVPAMRFIRAGEGLAGGGALTQDITLTLGSEQLQAIAAAQKQAEEALQQAEKAGDVSKNDLGNLAFKSQVTLADIAAAGTLANNAVLHGDGVWRPLPAGGGGGGEKGEKGDKGDKGEPGESGKDGRDGKDGQNGKDGLVSDSEWKNLSLAVDSTATRQSITLTKPGTDLKAVIETGFKTINGEGLIGTGDIKIIASGGEKGEKGEPGQNGISITAIRIV